MILVITFSSLLTSSPPRPRGEAIESNTDEMEKLNGKL